MSSQQWQKSADVGIMLLTPQTVAKAQSSPAAVFAIATLRCVPMMLAGPAWRCRV
jgi:hypothetical protein